MGCLYELVRNLPLETHCLTHKNFVHVGNQSKHPVGDEAHLGKLLEQASSVRLRVILLGKKRKSSGFGHSCMLSQTTALRSVYTQR
jgi:hypothetical protein